MPHHYQKRWVFTWNADSEGQQVDPQKLINFLNEVVEEGKNWYFFSAIIVLNGPRMIMIVEIFN